MADTPPLVFDTGFQPQTGEAVELQPGVVRVTAPNSGPFTFTGTNSYIVGRDSVAVVDPGPDDEAHRAALLRAVAGRPVAAIVLTHTHRDHSAGVPALMAATGAPLWSNGPHRLSRPLRPLELNPFDRESDWQLVPDRTLAHGDTVQAGDLELEVISTPGHCANHLAFGVAGTGLLLSGDHVMGWNSTVVAVPDGSMADYLDSLRKLIALPYSRYAPGHGGPIADGPGFARALLAHRELRNAQVLAAVNAGVRSVNGLVRRIYPKLSVKLRIAAALTLTAHVEYLEVEGRLRTRSTPLGLRLSPA